MYIVTQKSVNRDIAGFVKVGGVGVEGMMTLGKIGALV